MWDLPSCIRRHKGKLLILGGVIGGVTLLNSYLKKKFLEWDSRQSAEFCDQLKRSSHFDGTLKTCDSAIISFTPGIRKTICNILDVKSLLNQLNQNSANRSLWEQLKVLVFSQVIGEMYALCLLAIMIRVQMCVLSGYIFVNAQNSKNLESSSTSEKYLSGIVKFLENGIQSVLITVRKSVEDVVSTIPLNRPLKLKEINHILSEILDVISEGEFLLPNVSKALMPSFSKDATADKFLEKISVETEDVLDCKDFKKVFALCVEQGSSYIMDKLSECYGYLSNGKEFVNPNEFSAPLARLIPMMYKVFNAQDISEKGALVHILLKLEPLNSFAGNVYETFSQNES